jgi:glucuronokinase
VRLREYCREAGIELEDRNFTVEYESTIPPRSGLGGASAILTATLRAVLQYYGLMLPLPVQANLIWETERYELGMDVGPQGRVAQTYEGLVYMDFGREMMEGRGYGAYEWLDPGLASGVYVAYRTNYRGPESGKGVRLRAQWRAGEPETVAAMRTWAAFAEAGRKAMLAGDREQLHALIDSNLDLRMHMGDVEDEDAALARAARALGASANLAGSGGAIAGFYDGQEMLERLRLELSQMGARVMRAETGERREEGRV